MPEMEAMTRDVVAEQFAKLGGSLEPTAAEPLGDAGGGVDDSAPDSEPAHAPAGAGRDEKWRFAPKTAKEAAQAADTDPDPTKAQGGQGGAAPAVAQAAAPPAAAPELKPPADWRAAAKEKFKDSPREVQEEALRVYAETRKTLDRAAALEKEAGAWKEATGAYGHVFAGQAPHQVVGNLLRTFAALQGGHPQQRAAVVADIVRTYVGTDEQALRLLAAAIDGQPAAAAHAAPAQQFGPADVEALLERREQARARDAAVKTWQEFEATAEFLSEPGFRQRLATELSIAMEMKGGGQPTKGDFQAAYDAACGAHPTVSKIVSQRKEAEAAGKANASTQARTAAAVGIKNEPAVAGSESGPADTVRDEVKRQYVRLSNKRR